MGMENLNNWLEFVSDSGVLSVLLYLREYNPSVRIKDMGENLGIGAGKIRDIVSQLGREQMVQVSGGGYVRLTARGNVAVERLMEIG
ncbi:MAG: hypothetical protein V1676_00285 [Candidatus Diapherotrites archaeon]